MTASAQPLLVQCPACTQVTLGPHCEEGTQTVTPCFWLLCTDPKCQAVFDIVNQRAHRMAPERTMVTTPRGTFPVRVRMNLNPENGDWRDDPRDGA